MISLIIFVLFIIVGLYLKKTRLSIIDDIKETLHKLAWYNLLCVILLQFWSYSLEFSHLFFIALGFLLHICPVTIAVLLKDRIFEQSKYFLAYSTFGGGNRGALALMLLFPALLPHFFILDVGIFLSLLLVYPVASQYIYTNNDFKFFESYYRFLKPVMLASTLIITGVLFNKIEFLLAIPYIVFPIAKMTLIVLVSLYLGVNLSFNIGSIKKEILYIFSSRVFGVFFPVLLFVLFVFPVEHRVSILILLALTLFLPVSSIAPQLTPAGELREWVTLQVVISSSIYAIILSFVAIINSLYA